MLVGVLKNEPFHDSPLARFLLQRALQNRLLIGHHLYWLLEVQQIKSVKPTYFRLFQSDMNVESIARRHELMLAFYLNRCGAQREDLVQQKMLVAGLKKIAVQLKSISNCNGRKKLLRAELAKLPLPAKFQLPHDPAYALPAMISDADIVSLFCISVWVKGLVIEECKYMDSLHGKTTNSPPLGSVYSRSKQLPLFLVFENADPSEKERVKIIFKAGDDRYSPAHSVSY